MVNGSDVIEYEEENCGRLQTEFLENKGLIVDDDTLDTKMIQDLLESQEYEDFVVEDMSNANDY